MAARRSPRDADTATEVEPDVPDSTSPEASGQAEPGADEDGPDEEFGDDLSGFADEELEMELGDEVEEEEDTGADGPEEVVDPAGLEDDTGDADEDDGQDPVVATVVTSEAAFDDEEDARVVAAAAGDGDDDEDDEAFDGLRDDEFVCRSCFMVLSTSQLVDPDAMLCRDCA